MTEILDADDYQPGGYRAEKLTTNQAREHNEHEQHNGAGRGSGRFRSTIRAALEPGALAVAAVLALTSAATIGPSYPFHSYPFNQGVTSLDIYNQIRAQSVHPLHDFLYNSAPMIFLTSVALVAAIGSLSRHTRWAWARPVAAGALLISVAFVVIVAAGAYRASTWDLAIPDPNAVTTTG